MNFKALSAILLFSFSLPVVTRYKIFPAQSDQYWLYGILFFSLIGFCVLSVYFQKKFSFIRSILFWICIAISLGGASISVIHERHVIAPIWKTHDIILQQEAAMRYLLQGKNPYKETYFGTPVEMFNYDEPGNPDAVNPALYHFVMPPGYLLVPFPFYWIANRLFGYFDGRMVLIVFMIGTLMFLWKWFRKSDIAEVAIIFTSLSPASVDFFLEGRSDAFALFFLVGALFFLFKKYTIMSVIFFSFAILSKQTMWFAIPLYGAYLCWLHKKHLQKIFQPIILMGIIVAGCVVPFLVWDTKAFLDSVIFYLSSGGEKGYPVSGYGLSMILYSLGIIRDIHDYYPFIIWQGIFGGITMLATIRFFLQKPSDSRFLIAFSLTLFAVWYTSRYFNNSHIATIAGLFGLGILKHYDEA
ncbi:MAG: glycosyltransferase family 39 protein [Patescibacteria group bacterium]|nr:glycosyltransferase family 39 protein [Patescibacteria group bacterium]